jgi:hypothetical protein
MNLQKYYEKFIFSQNFYKYTQKVVTMSISLQTTTSLRQHIAKEVSVNRFCILNGDLIKNHSYFFDELVSKEFRDSWNNLRVDNHMNDGGKYRSRRYSVFNYKFHSKELIEKPGEQHYQEKAVNYLNGGLNRYFETIEDRIKNNSLFVNLIRFCIGVFEGIEGPNNWRIEPHQFRIKATAELNGSPTPEGIHRDGVKYVFIMFIGKENVIGGESHIYDNKKNHIISYMMEKPFDCAFLDDTKLMHSVSPIICNLSGNPSYRDTLVITFRNL